MPPPMMRGMPAPMGPMHLLLMPGPGLDRLLSSVDATDAQRAQIVAIGERARTAAAPERPRTGGSDDDPMASQRDTMRAAFTAERVDVDAVRAAEAQRLEAQSRRSHIMTTASIDAANVLSATQRTRLLAAFDACRPGDHPAAGRDGACPLRPPGAGPHDEWPHDAPNMRGGPERHGAAQADHAVALVEPAPAPH